MIGFSIFLTLFIPSRCGRTARSGNAGNADIQANKMNNITGTRTNQQLYIMRENTAAEISLRRCCCFCIKPAYSADAGRLWHVREITKRQKEPLSPMVPFAW
jgi:hypothetical protein